MVIHSLKVASLQQTQMELFTKCPDDIVTLTIHRGNQMPSEHNKITEADKGETTDMEGTK